MLQEPGYTNKEHPSDAEVREYSFGCAGTELIENMEKHLIDCGQCARTVADLVLSYTRAQRDARSDYFNGFQ